MYYDQSAYDLRCEWGLEGIRQLAPTSDVLIIVDVFSFTTAVDIAVSRGAYVYPFFSAEESAEDFARRIGAVCAVHRRQDPEGFSLSPVSMLRLPEGAKLVLPSPNGSRLSLSTGDTPTFAGCLRNANAVAAAAGRLGRRIGLIPAGERWPDGSLRPSLEDLLGAGAILRALPGTRSPEAEAAVAVFNHFRDRLLETLSACGSGLEIADRGLPGEISLVADYNASLAAPRLIDGAYRSTQTAQN